MTQIFNAKTVEDAKELAARTFGVAESQIQFEVLEEPKKGFLGLVTKGEAKIKATYIPEKSESATSAPETESVPENMSESATSAPETESAPESRSESATSASETESAPEGRSESATSAPETESAPEGRSESATSAPETESAPESRSESATSALETESAPESRSESATSALETESAPESRSESATSAPADQQKEKNSIQPDEELITGVPSETSLAKIEKAKEYLLNILETMGIKAELKVNAGKDSAIIEIVTHNSGAIIGKRGETLDSLQYLTFMTANRTDKEYYRIILNTANYRERRRKTLEELAAKIAKNVLHSHRSTTLEPMNPYERRIIHSAIAEIEGVSSKSIGEEPYRKVVISSDEKPPKSGKRRNYHDKNEKSDRPEKGRGRNRGRRDTRKNPDAPPTRISMDSMKTSFEKDYKRPKPEDDINAGLYGKIEF